MAKRKILLYADTYNDKVTINNAYVDFFSLFGEVILVLPSNNMERLLEEGDILALPGGADVDPMRYGEYPTAKVIGRTNPHFEYLDKNLLEPWILTGKPIIGICRGLQTLNVAMGGSLYQHIDGHALDTARDERKQTMHTFIPGYEMHKINSFHHQAIKRLADGFEVLGWTAAYKNCPSIRTNPSPEGRECWEKVDINGKSVLRIQRDFKDKTGDGRIYWYTFPEIIKHTTRPYVAFQYHPEEFYCSLAIDLIEKTLNIEHDKENAGKKALSRIGSY